MITAGKEEIVLWNKQHQATIAIISTNAYNRDAPLEKISSQLFIGMKKKEMVLKEPSLVNNKKTIHTRLTCEINGCKQKIDSYVFMTGSSVCDFVYWAPADTFDNARGDFENMVRSLKFTEISE